MKGTENLLEFDNSNENGFLDADNANETLKNTFYNKFLGKLNK